MKTLVDKILSAEKMAVKRKNQLNQEETLEREKIIKEAEAYRKSSLEKEKREFEAEANKLREETDEKIRLMEKSNSEIIKKLDEKINSGKEAYIEEMFNEIIGNV